MGGSLPNSALARMAAMFFMLSALLGPLARFSRGDSAAPLGAEMGALSFGLAALFLPWDRWPRGALHGVAAAGFALKVVTTLEIGASPWLYSLHYVMLFMWIGAAIGPRKPLLWALPAAAAYVGPMLWIGGDRAAIASVMLVIPGSVFTGEAAGWLAAHLRSAGLTSQMRAKTMAGLVDATSAMAASQESDELARLAALGAVESRPPPPDRSWGFASLLQLERSNLSRAPSGFGTYTLTTRFDFSGGT
jgi:hypothetical protein